MRTKEPNENTCGAHEEECTNWCEIHNMWECDQCYSMDWEERQKIYNEKYEKWEENRRNFLKRVEESKRIKL